MSDITEVEKDSSNLKKTVITPGKVISYRSNRFFLPLLIGLLTGLFTLETRYPAWGFFAFIISGLVLDWWYFQYKKHKDSEQVSEELCQVIGITRNQIDETNHYIVTARKASLAASISVTAALTLFSGAFSWQSTLILSYMVIISSLTIFGIISKKIIPLITLENRLARGTSKYHALSNPAYSFSPNESFYSATNDCFTTNNFHFSSEINSFNTGIPQNMLDPCDARNGASYLPGGVMDTSRYD